jgi:nucleoside-diphosphate-sugar epimerase
MADFAPKMNWAENMEACVHVGERTNALSIPVVFASSASVYGYSPGEARTESDPVAPIGHYSKSKAAAEEWFRANHHHAVILRQATVMGVSPRMRFDLLTNGMTKDAWAKGRLPVLYGGREVRAQVHVQDLVDAYEAVLGTPKLAAGVYNVSSTNDRVMELAERIRTQLAARGREVRLDVTDEPRQPRSYALTSEKFSSATGWKPTRTVADTVDEVCDLVDRIGPAADDPRAYNIRWMKLVFEAQSVLDRVGRIDLED